MFVGRDNEIKAFVESISQPHGQAILICGHSGMGKTSLLSKLAEVCETTTDLECNHVHYEITQTDSVDSILSLVMNNMIDAANVTEGSFAGTPRRKQQWKALFSGLGISNIADLVASLKYKPEVSIRNQFAERLSLVSSLMQDHQRLIVFFDPEKYMQPSSDQSWSVVVRSLPSKIIFVFAQRPEDVLASSGQFTGNQNVTKIPQGNLGGLDDESMDLLLNSFSQNLPYTTEQLNSATRPYNGHPYATAAALFLLKDGLDLDSLPEDPTPGRIVEEQWKRVCSKGPDAISLFESYASLGVPVPDAIIEHVGDLTHEVRLSLMANSFLSGMIRSEGTGRRLYHAILSDYISNSVGDEQKQAYLQRAYEKVFSSEDIGFFDKIRFLELLQQQESFADNVIRELLTVLSQQFPLKRDFSVNCQNVGLIRRLYEEGFFAELSDPVETDGGISYPGWVEGLILVRLADQIPEIVSEIAVNAKTENYRVYNALLEAIAKLDIQQIHGLWPTVISWLQTCKWHFLPDDYPKMAMKLIDNEYIEDSMSLLAVTLKPDPPPKIQTENIYLKHEEAVGILDFHELDTVVRPVVQHIEEKNPLATVALVNEFLSQAIQYECTASSSDYPKTSYWRRAIEDHDQNLRAAHLKDFLLVVLRDALGNAIEKIPTKVREVVEGFLRQDSQLHKRIALHVIRLARERYVDLAFDVLMKPGSLHDLYLHHEVFLVLRDIFPLLNGDQRGKLLTIIKAGPDAEKLRQEAQWAKENFSDQIDVEDYFVRRKDCWIRDRLQMVKNSLTGSDATYYGELVNTYKENEHPDLTSYVETGGFVSHVPPPDTEGWDSMSAKECVDYMVSWEPSAEDEGDYLSRVCPKGVAGLFVETLKKRWDEFTPELHRLVENAKYPTYVTSLFDFVIENHNDDKSEEDGKGSQIFCCNSSLLLDLVGKAVHRWKNADATKDTIENGYSLSVCKSGVRLVTQILTAKGKEYSFSAKSSSSRIKQRLVSLYSLCVLYFRRRNRDLADLFQKSKNVLLELCCHPDPGPDEDDPQQENYSGFRDPITVSINHLRPMALRELLRYSVVRSNILKLKGKRWESDVESKVTEMLLQDTAYSVGSVIGESWAWLYHLDQAWAREKHKTIFPISDPQGRRFVTAWDSYITHEYYVNDVGYDLMRPLYVAAIDNAISENTTHTNLAPRDSLAGHLIGFYRLDIESLPSDEAVKLDNPLQYAYSLAPNKIHSHMAWSLWKVCEDAKDTSEKLHIWKKAKVLWEYRIESVGEDHWNEHFARELSWFIYFLKIAELRITPDHVRDLLARSITPLGGYDREHGLRGLVDYLSSVATSHISDSVIFLAQIFEAHGVDWYLKDESVKFILDNAGKAGQDVRDRACSIVHRLGESGKDWARSYLDELRR